MIWFLTVYFFLGLLTAWCVNKYADKAVLSPMYDIIDVAICVFMWPLVVMVEIVTRIPDVIRRSEDDTEE